MRRNSFIRLAWFKVIFKSILMTLVPLSVSAQEVEDSVVNIINNWDTRDCAYYHSYGGRYRVEDGDTITVRERPETIIKVLLAGELPEEDDDKVFVVTTQYADSSSVVKSLSEILPIQITSEGSGDDSTTKQMSRSKEELVSQLIKLTETPVTYITDAYGAVIDIYDYQSLKSEMDSCFMHLKGEIARSTLPDGTKLSLVLNMQRLWDQLSSKESLMANCEIFKLYGYQVPIGTTIEHTKLPMLNSEQMIDATMTTICDILVSEAGDQYAEITSVVSYDFNQIMDYVINNFLSEEERENLDKDSITSEVIAITFTEKYLYDLQKGTLVEYIKDSRTITPFRTLIDFSTYQLQ